MAYAYQILTRGVLPFLLCILATTKEAVSQEIDPCVRARADSYLDINNVRARVLNHGGLFYGSSPGVYEVPIDGGFNPISASGLWLSGLTTSGIHRAATTSYGNTDFWPGPLDENGSAPVDCAQYDRVYNVSIRDLLLYEELGIISDDLSDWPYELGAPVVDGDGNPDNYNLAGGDRPEIIGHQTLWWMMNDMGGVHKSSKTPSIGLEVVGNAFAVTGFDAPLKNATFYRYLITYKGDEPLHETYVGFFQDQYSADLGGIDTTLGLSFYYQPDNRWEGSQDGSIAPPAFGVDMLSGPVDLIDGIETKLGIASFITGDEVHEGYGGDVLRNHISGYTFLGRPILDGCFSHWDDPPYCIPGASRRHTGVMYPGDPVAGVAVSGLNYDGLGNELDNTGHGSLMSSGPFTFYPGDVQEVVFAVLWAQGVDHLDSITRLREASTVVQQMWDNGSFTRIDLPSVDNPTNAPTLISPANGATNQAVAVNLVWNRVEHASAYLLEFGLSPNLSNRTIEVVSSEAVAGCNGSRYREVCSGWYTFTSLLPATEYYWRVTAIGAESIGPSSPVSSFLTGVSGPVKTPGAVFLSNGKPAYIEISGPGGFDPCSGNNSQDIGCIEVGGNLIRDDVNSTNDWYVYDNDNSLNGLTRYAPNDFEIRFSEDFAYAFDGANAQFLKVPFTVWDIGDTGPFTQNDPADDIQLIPVVDEPTCEFVYGNGNAFEPLKLGWNATPSIDAALYAAKGYADFAAIAESEFGDSDLSCVPIIDPFDPYDESPLPALSWVNFYGNPDGPSYSFGHPPAGTVVRFLSSDFATSSPILAAPNTGNVSVPQPVQLYWNSTSAQSGFIIYHHVQVAESPTFLENEIVLSEIRQSESMETPGLEGGKTYYWRVRSTRRSGGRFSPWSSVWNFTAGSPVGIEGNTNTEGRLELHQNYPNPFSTNTTVSYTLPNPAEARLELFNLLGQRVRILMSDVQSSGDHQFDFKSNHLSSGVYFLRLTAGDLIATKRLVVVR